jgi:drug/metabolite transporter (DMT)-like permease
MAIERVGAAVTAQTGLIGPLSTIAFSVVLLGEPFTVWMALGTVLVLAGVWLLARSAHEPVHGARRPDMSRDDRQGREVESES